MAIGIYTATRLCMFEWPSRNRDLGMAQVFSSCLGQPDAFFERRVLLSPAEEAAFESAKRR